MIQVTVTNPNKSGSPFKSTHDSMELAQAWLQSCSNKPSQPFGKPEHTIQVEVSPYIPAQYEEQSVLVKEAVLDEEGNELEAAEYELQMVEVSPAVEAVFEDQVVPSEFEVEIVDITAQVEQAEINRQARDFLAATDWMVIRALEKGEELSVEFKAERQAARDSIVD